MQRILLTRAVRSLQARANLRHSSSSAASSNSSSSDSQLEVDELCLPLTSPYSLPSLIPPSSTSNSPLTPETLIKLHKLSALLPPSASDPSTSSHLPGLEELISIVQAVREVDTSSLGLKRGEMVDARIRAEPEPIDLFANDKGRAKEVLDVEGEVLLQGAERREGRFFVAQMPENVRRRKSSASNSGIAMEDEGEGEPF